MARHLLGLALVMALAAAGYWAWTQVGGWLRIPPFRDLRIALTDLRLPLQVLAAFLVVSGADWVWRKLFPGA
ncbi:MAG: hypothetical protein KTR21_02735 [Rhodobacteraceae bacterium]|nr:hypothetical protein [Paracoccaceae bacterium]